jgi:hypothetical protein
VFQTEPIEYIERSTLCSEDGSGAIQGSHGHCFMNAHGPECLNNLKSPGYSRFTDGVWGQTLNRSTIKPYLALVWSEKTGNQIK